LYPSAAIYTSLASVHNCRPMPATVPGNVTPMPTVVEITNAAAMAVDISVCVQLVPLSDPILRLRL